MVKISAGFQQGMESVSSFKMNTVTELAHLRSSNGNILFSVTELI